jgi:hypothetical protein
MFWAGQFGVVSLGTEVFDTITVITASHTAAFSQSLSEVAMPAIGLLV